jgi:hypothetical protein
MLRISGLIIDVNPHVVIPGAENSAGIFIFILALT